MESFTDREDKDKLQGWNEAKSCSSRFTIELTLFHVLLRPLEGKKVLMTQSSEVTLTEEKRSGVS